MEKQTWRLIAIISIVLLVLETSYVVWALNIGNEIIYNENECSVNICDSYDAYNYDEYNKICYCYRGDEVAYQKYIG